MQALLEHLVASYTEALGVQFGLQAFTPKAEGKSASWTPSTVYIAQRTLTQVLLDTSSRCTTKPSPSLPEEYGALAACVRELHATIFQPYGIWLRATNLLSQATLATQAHQACGLRRGAPDFYSLHFELADLCLYWLLYSEAANLRHTPELLWFIFFCAQTSWQYKAVLMHLYVHHEAIMALPGQAWFSLLGATLPEVMRKMHSAYRAEDPSLWAPTMAGIGMTPLRKHALLHIVAEADDCDEAAITPKPSNGGAASAALPPSGSSDPARSIASAAAQASAFAAAAASQAAQAAAALGVSNSPSSHLSAVSSLKSMRPPPLPTVGLVGQGRGTIDPQQSGLAPRWEAHAAPSGYPDMLMRLCPDEAAVAASLSCWGWAPGAPEGPLFTSRVVQPLFHFMAEQIFELGQARRQGLESGIRITYDDMTESMAHPAVVRAALASLPWDTSLASRRPGGRGTSGGGAGGQRAAAARDAELYWSRLLALGERPAVRSTRIPWKGDMLHYKDQILDAISAGDPHANLPFTTAAASAVAASTGALAPPSDRSSVSSNGLSVAAGGHHSRPGTAQSSTTAMTAMTTATTTGPVAGGLAGDAQPMLRLLCRSHAAADWWARHVFRKTFVEHRSLLMPAVAFGRVFQFQLVWFYVIAAWSWADNTMAWIASAAAVHWASTCVLLTAELLTATRTTMRRKKHTMPFYATSAGLPAHGQAAPRATHSELWWLLQFTQVLVSWALLAVGVYIFFTAWPTNDVFGLQCYDLFLGRSCYWWLACVYTAMLLAYYGLYRQLVYPGGYVRAPLASLASFFLIHSGLDPGHSRLYEPSVHLATSVLHMVCNGAMWGLALALKFVLDYFLLIKPAKSTFIAIFDTHKLAWTITIPHSTWWPPGWTRSIGVSLDPLLAACLGTLLFIMSIVVTSVSYSLATAAWGALQGAYQGVGGVRNWGHIRAGFHTIQTLMRDKIVCSETLKPPAPPRSSLVILLLSGWRALVFVVALPVNLVMALLRWCGLAGRADGPASWKQREQTMALTAPFWNAIVSSLRQRDLLSDKEAAALSFMPVTMSPASLLATMHRINTMGRATVAVSASTTMPGGAANEVMMGPHDTYLPPVAVYAGQIPDLLTANTPSTSSLEVLQEAYLYLLHLLVAVNIIPREPHHASGGRPSVPVHPGSAGGAGAAAESPLSSLVPDLHRASFSPDMFKGMSAKARSPARQAQRKAVLNNMITVIKALQETAKVFNDSAGPLTACNAAAATAAAATGGSAAVQAARGKAIDKLAQALHALARTLTSMSELPWSIKAIFTRVVDRQHYHQPAVKAELARGFACLLSPQNASMGDFMPHVKDFNRVLSWLLDILTPPAESPGPSNPEAVAFLAEFCAGLYNPHMPAPPRVEDMRSVTTLIPHYQETVMYALSNADVRRVLQAHNAPAPGGGGSTPLQLEGALPEDEVLFKNDDGDRSELTKYLLSEFPEEFKNLMERMKTLRPLPPGEPAYTLDDFLPGGRLHVHRAQLLLWASFRGQVLARTVDGMSMYRMALVMQAVHDALHAPRHPSAGGNKKGSGEGMYGVDAPGALGRLRLSPVQGLMVRGILQEPGLGVEELIAQLVDVVPELGALVERKYSLVVSSQVFARMAGGKGLADRWRAHSVKLLLSRYPALKVCYLEGGESAAVFKAPDFTYSVSQQYSVMMRAVPLAPEAASVGPHGMTTLRSFGHSLTRDNSLVRGGMYKLDGAVTPGPGGPTPGPGGPTPGPAALLAANGSDGTPLTLATLGTMGSGASGGSFGAAADGSLLARTRARQALLDLRAADTEVMFRQLQPVNPFDGGAGVILGEGKPENQNSAVIYCPGVLLQTIDMNQDNTFAQALKLRNVTSAFTPRHSVPRAGGCCPGPYEAGLPAQQVAVVGYPEWIFSYRCGLLADLAAATERTFGTQIQRVMDFPSGVRAHYGHPDLWNRLFSMTRGGVSKANAVQHVSEDVFGGYNALKRGGLSTYVSYMSVGKGRDMGLDSILGFEGKISKGCGEQLMSRDVRFLGTHLDFFRTMSFYFTGPGHFINTLLTVMTITFGIWTQLLLILAGVAKQNSNFAAAAGAVQILQLGTLPIIGYLANVWVEEGLGTALITIFRQFVAGGLLFHIFRSCTSAHHLLRATLFGGASYVATGRGFSLKRKSLTQVFCNYGRSHIYMGADILIMVILILVYANNGGSAAPVPAAALWSPLLVAAALLVGPFWFTPFFFRLHLVLRDTRDLTRWLNGGRVRGVPESWVEWNAGQLAPLRDDAKGQITSYRIWSTLALLAPRAAMSVLSIIVCVTGARFDSSWLPDWAWVLVGSGATWIGLALWTSAKRAYLATGLSGQWRWIKGVVQVALILAFFALVAVCVFMPKRGLRFSGLLVTLYANYQAAWLVVAACVLWLPKSMTGRSISNHALWQGDKLLAYLLCAFLIIICVIGEIGLVMVDRVQTLVQFNDRFSSHTAATRYNDDDDPAAAALAGRKLGGGGGGALGGRAAGLLGLPPGTTLKGQGSNTNTLKGQASNTVKKTGGGKGGKGGALARLDGMGSGCHPASGHTLTAAGAASAYNTLQAQAELRYRQARDGAAPAVISPVAPSDVNVSVNPTAAAPASSGGHQSVSPNLPPPPPIPGLIASLPKQQQQQTAGAEAATAAPALAPRTYVLPTAARAPGGATAAATSARAAAAINTAAGVLALGSKAAAAAAPGVLLTSTSSSICYEDDAAFAAAMGTATRSPAASPPRGGGGGASSTRSIGGAGSSSMGQQQQQRSQQQAASLAAAGGMLPSAGSSGAYAVNLTPQQAQQLSTPTSGLVASAINAAMQRSGTLMSNRRTTSPAGSLSGAPIPMPMPPAAPAPLAGSRPGTGGRVSDSGVSEGGLSGWVMPRAVPWSAGSASSSQQLQRATVGGGSSSSTAAAAAAGAGGSSAAPAAGGAAASSSPPPPQQQQQQPQQQQAPGSVGRASTTSLPPFPAKSPERMRTRMQ